MSANHTQSPDEMMRETERTRDGIERNLEELERRLSPDEMLDQVGQAVAPARDGAVQFARNLGDVVRENPIPAAMVGIGLGWLLISSRRGESGASGAAYYPAERHDPARPSGDAGAYQDDDDSGLGKRARDAREWARERSARARDTAGEAADTAYRRASDTAYRAGTQVQNRAATVGNVVQTRPILTGLVVAGIGAVIAAAAFARTDRGKRTISRASEAVRSTAEDASAAAAEAAARAGERLNDAVEKTKAGAAAAGEAARERAEEVRDKVKGAGSEAESGAEGAASNPATAASDTRSVGEQLDSGPGSPDALKPAAVKPVPVSPPPFGDERPPVGVGEMEHHDASGVGPSSPAGPKPVKS